MLVAFWAACLILYLALRRNRANMCGILGGIALPLLVRSIGPSGIIGLTISSQLTRFAHYPEAHGMLKDGKTTPPAAKLPNDIISDKYSFPGRAAECRRPGPTRAMVHRRCQYTFQAGYQPVAVQQRHCPLSRFPNTGTQSRLRYFTANAEPHAGHADLFSYDLATTHDGAI